MKAARWLGGLNPTFTHVFRTAVDAVSISGAETWAGSRGRRAIEASGQPGRCPRIGTGVRLRPLFGP